MVEVRHETGIFKESSKGKTIGEMKNIHISRMNETIKTEYCHWVKLGF